MVSLIISFAWTTPAFLADRKHVTRRDWKPRHAAQFHVGQVVDAWDKIPIAGGQKIGRIILKRDPYPESTADIPESDYELEGFAYMDEHGLTLDGMKPAQVWRDWHDHPRVLTVVRFYKIGSGAL